MCEMVGCCSTAASTAGTGRLSPPRSLGGPEAAASRPEGRESAGCGHDSAPVGKDTTVAAKSDVAASLRPRRWKRL